MSAAGVLIKYKSSVLLAKRAEEHNGYKISFGGFWSFFLGSKEPPAEPSIICAIRELYEEAGIKLTCGEVNFLKTYYNNPAIIDVFYADLDSLPDVFLNFEHTEYGWFSIESIESFPYDIDPMVIDAIQNLPN
jgi:8-oxo-dGTP pyrophosphatase MutT (NUDIX family)